MFEKTIEEKINKDPWCKAQSCTIYTPDRGEINFYVDRGISYDKHLPFVTKIESEDGKLIVTFDGGRKRIYQNIPFYIEYF